MLHIIIVITAVMVTARSISYIKLYYNITVLIEFTVRVLTIL